MKKNKEVTLYNERTWLNDDTTPSTGSCVCYHGICRYPEEETDYENMFFEVSDCHVKSRLHKTVFETKEQFINKLNILKKQIELFVKHLEEYE